MAAVPGVTDDAGLVEEIRGHVAHLPTYGYRHIWALLRRSREQTGAPCVNAKRVYRVMVSTSCCCVVRACGEISGGTTVA